MFIDHRQEQWTEWLGTAEFAYNNKVNTSTKVSPFRANSGRDPRMGFEMRRQGKSEGAKEFTKRMKTIQEEAQAALKKVQEEMKKQADRKRSGGILGRRLSTVKYKRFEMADGRKKNREVNGEICRTLQNKEGHINQCSGIRATEDGQNPPSSERK